jgi:DNA-binding MarR family transcriptional regulator
LMAELGSGARPSELARRLGVSKSAVAQVVDRLERAGYVEHAPDPTDTRAKQVKMTSRAEHAKEAAAQALEDIEAEWLRLLGKRRFDELRDALALLDAWRNENETPLGHPTRGHP